MLGLPIEISREYRERTGELVCRKIKRADGHETAKFFRDFTCSRMKTTGRSEQLENIVEQYLETNHTS